VNGDGYQDFLVGAVEWSSASLSRCGRAWLFLGSSTGPVASTWTREGSIAGQGLGASVALADLDADGYSDVVVGSSVPEGVSVPPAGKVEVFYGGPSGPPLDPGLVLRPTPSEESFGFTVASVGDVNGDGVGDLAVGAPRFNGGRGAAPVYAGTLGRSMSNIPMRQYEGIEAFQGLGWAIAGGGDVDGDGLGDFVIGSPGFDGGTTDMGRLDSSSGTRRNPRSLRHSRSRTASMAGASARRSRRSPTATWTASPTSRSARRAAPGARTHSSADRVPATSPRSRSSSRTSATCGGSIPRGSRCPTA
jgi:hypothetical protein